jgi:hypothetical protein
MPNRDVWTVSLLLAPHQGRDFPPSCYLIFVPAALPLMSGVLYSFPCALHVISCYSSDFQPASVLFSLPVRWFLWVNAIRLSSLSEASGAGCFSNSIWIFLDFAV